ncbi:hypothetical protein EK21DRAFT_109362 [Setomelanomma holmii]|uniref:Uncharacterized protein n=1 Tax=Setomelanomma holmii TaxID=210430 RepID=A0A9P4LMN7_9PLEO|nr:hypothetical protein EK21DRAFT_109362 [Setomelanomma holmii]
MGKKKLQQLASGLKQSMATRGSTNKNIEKDLRATWDEGDHPDEEVIVSPSKLWAVLAPHWAGNKLDANMMNLGTGRRFSSSHHVKGEAEKTKENFKALEYCVCLEWMWIKIGGKMLLGRCLNTYCYKSDGCTEHNRTVYKDGPNSIYPLPKAGKTVTWAMIQYRAQETSQIPEADTEAAKLLKTVEEQKTTLQKERKEIEDQIDEATMVGDYQRVNKLLAAHARLQASTSSKTSVLKNLAAQPEPQKPEGSDSGTAAPQAAVDGSQEAFKNEVPVYNARRGFNANAPGIDWLDKKETIFSNPQKRRVKQQYTTAAAKKAAATDEEAGARTKTRKKGKKPVGAAT